MEDLDFLPFKESEYNEKESEYNEEESELYWLDPEWGMIRSRGRWS